MSESLKAWLADLIKWVLIIIISAIAFYIVYPKYQFVEEGLIRGNRITGQVEILVNGNWKSLGKSQSRLTTFKPITDK